MAFLDPSRGKGWIAFPVLAALLGSLRSLRGELVWDDGLFVERSMAIGMSLSGHFLRQEGALGDYYRPVCNLLASVVYSLAGIERPWAWHLVNVVLHAATAAGVYRLLRRWLEASAPQAALGASLFALWPTGVDAVSWVSACSELLMGLFVVWGLVLQLRARDRGGVAAGAALLHLCALLSKEVGVVFLPLAVTATYLVPRPQGSSVRTPLLRLFGPHLLVLGAYTLMRAQAVGPGSSLVALAGDRLRPDALAPALFAWGWYLRECLLFGSGSPYVESPAASAVTWVFALGGLLLFARALDASRRPRERPFALAGIWFLIALAPSLAFAAAPISITPVALRYLYLPSVAVSAMLTAALQRVPRDLGAPRVRVLAVSAAAVVLFTMGWARQSPWLSDRALWARAAEDNPHSSIARLNLGLAQVVAGDVSAGEENLRRAAWNPEIPDGPTKQSMLVRVGEYYLQAKRPEQAREAFALAAQMEGSPATAARARAGAVSLEMLAARQPDGSLHLSREGAKRQIAVLEQVAALDPRDTASRLLLAMLDEALGEPVLALARHEEIARASVSRPERRDAALASVARLLQRVADEPDPVRRGYHEGQLHALRGETDAAIRSYREVLAADPNRPDVLQATAALLSRSSRGAEAVEALQQAAALVPLDPSVWYNLGIERQRNRDFAGAADSFGRAIELAPDWWKPYVPRGLALESAGDPAGAAASYEAFLSRFQEPADVREEVAARLSRVRAVIR